MKQLVGNACGTIAILHSVINNIDQVQPSAGFIRNFYDETKNLDAIARGNKLGESNELHQIHDVCVVDGQTQAPDADADTGNHFIAFSNVNGHIYEYDGCKAFPINHGATTADSFLNDVAKVIQREFFDRASEEEANRFSILTFGKAQ
jgi:ubiquitin carboxyl-terminal hydrolase L3